MTQLILQAVVRALDDKKGEDIEIIHVEDVNPFAQYYVLCTADNSRRLNALKEASIEAIEKLGKGIHHFEGKSKSEWILIDAYDIVIHIFSPDERERLDFDELFAHQKRIPVEPVLLIEKK